MRPEVKLTADVGCAASKVLRWDALEGGYAAVLPSRDAPHCISSPPAAQRRRVRRSGGAGRGSGWDEAA